MTTIPPNWLLERALPKRAPSVPPGVEYHRVLAGEKRRIGRGVLAIVMLLAGLVIFPTGLGALTGLIDLQNGHTTPLFQGTDYTPLYHASSMLSLFLLMPWSMLIQRWLYGVPGASMHSVISRFRFDLLGKSLLVFGPFWILANAVGYFAPSVEVPWTQFDLVAIFIGTLLLTPLQTTGEEYGVRGLLFRVLGSWTRSRKAGLVFGIIGSSVIFTAVHMSTDIYINIWYFVLWSCLAVITWRTGGVEIAVVLHAVLNTFSLVSGPLFRIDLGGALSDRSAGVGSVTQLIPTAAVVLITLVILWWTRKAGPALTPTAPSDTADAIAGEK
ncbi:MULTISPECIES: CPBP family intramembrane glutamic endopeptidase [unclassified Microbacterium]|uniref:CPBP family intramembrane glutamic endopeptidase n=1 Tax=unclassified Microbacterium TaxID=2609290 RepID=UPI000EA96F5C|nr:MULTISPECIES: type II CAAX endopeptidase family protein [unclassified Microbacterium]MBT2486430.1 CPBP family intramembrane metalloprotease [Microbacterium sp. ISL-108]RKN69130.1 CPBP family intramembrane metalloprotease [Microbacterium sp. CGR2]